MFTNISLTLVTENAKIVADLNEDEAILSIDTLLRIRHDVYLMYLKAYLAENKDFIMHDNEIESLQPDLLLSSVATDSSNFYVGEVTFTKDSDVIEKKREKYRFIGNVLISSYDIDELERFITTPEGLVQLLAKKNRYILESNAVIDNYIRQLCKLFPGLNLFDMAIYQSYHKEYKPFSWKTPVAYSCKYRPDDFPNMNILKMEEDKDEDGIVELKQDVLEVLRELMADTNITSFYNMEAVDEGIFKNAEIALADIRDKEYIQCSEFKPSCLFYSTILDTKFSTSHRFATEQECIMFQFGLLSTIESPLKTFFENMLNTLQDPKSRSIFETGNIGMTSVTNEDMRLLYTSIRNLKKKTVDVNEMQPDYLDILNNNTQLKCIIDKLKSVTTNTGDWEFDLLMTDKKFVDWCDNVLTGENSQFNAPFVKTLTVDKTVFLDPAAVEFLKRSKTNMSNTQYIADKLQKIQNRHEGSNPHKTYCGPDTMSFKKMVANLTLPTKLFLPKEVREMIIEPGVDNNFFQTEKKKFLEKFVDYVTILGKTPALKFGFNMKRTIEQLLHLQNLNFKIGNYSFFNNNCSDYLYCVQHGLQDKGHDVGRAFFIIKFGKITQLEINYFGFKYHFGNTTDEVHYTDWRRLPSQRLSFHADQVYSVLSTGFATYCRAVSTASRTNKSYNMLALETCNVFSTRLLVALCHSQQTAELLSDVRYLYMGAFSTFTSLSMFISEKYSKPISNCIDEYIIRKIPQFQKVRDEYMKGKVQIFNPKYSEGKRDIKTLGGNLRLNACIHVGFVMTDVQDLLDEMFLYVHTNKEPSSQYHEFVKAVKVLEKFQKEFDSNTSEQQQGIYQDVDDLKQFLLSGRQVGFYNKATRLAALITSEKLKNENIERKVKHRIETDTILDMNSTKSIIPERHRELSICETPVIYTDLKSSKVIRKKRKLLWKLLNDTICLTGTLSTLPKGHRDTLTVTSGTNRCKVHDSTIDLYNGFKFTKTWELAAWNAKNNNMRMATDICIKAQYGAKREFYVINHGAKALARCVELGFRVICESLDNEMISVPGDRKMFVMQQLMDTILQTSKAANMMLYYVNGDCSKWSAAETMECLYTYAKGLKDITGKDFMNLTTDALFAWSNKNVTMPPDLYKNVYYKGPINTNLRNDGTFKSTQNFLQGMFNYLSSSKAVSCSMLLEWAWSQLYPESNLTFSHMEHSDDYAFIVLAENDSEFLRFKTLHRILMKMCGINDSVKKTNSQHFLSEFISLISFNGVMTYPHIKKVKETGLNIGACGYSSDIKVTCSRVGEAARVGVTFDVCYAMSRIQTYRIAEAYGLFSANKDIYNSESPFNTPIELWGFPDCHPILYLLTQGNPDNYRLSKYGDAQCKEKLDKLYYLKLLENPIKSDDVFSEESLLGTQLFHPHYTYMTQGNLIRKIKKQLAYTIEDAQAYWEKHFIDLYIKPKDPDRYNDWLKSKYFQNGFVEAYLRQGRSQLQMRLSHFVRQHCLSVSLVTDAQSYVNLPEELLLKDKLWTIKDYVDQVQGWELEILDKDIDVKFKKLIEYSFDPNVLKIYGYTDSAILTNQSDTILYTKAFPEPQKSYAYSCVNDPGRILQFLCYKKDFYNDNYKPTSITTFLQDIDRVKKLLASCGMDMDQENNLDFGKFRYRNVVLEILYSMRAKTKPILTMFNPENNPTQTIHKLLELHTSSNMCYTLRVGVAEELAVREIERNPETQMYLNELNLTEEWFLNMPELLNDLTLLLFLVKDRSLTEIRDVFLNVKLFNSSTTSLNFISKMLHRYVYENVAFKPEFVQQICALSDVLLDSPEGFLKYMKGKLGYTYKYQNNMPSEGFVTILVTCFGHTYKLVFMETHGKKGHNLSIFTNNANLTQLSWVYCIGLRLMGSISVNELIHRLNLQTSEFLPKERPLPIYKTATQIYKNVITGKLVVNPDPTTDVIVPIQLVDERFILTTGEFDSYHTTAKFDTSLFSAYSQAAKVFTINVFKLHQVNAWRFFGIDKLPINALLSNTNLTNLFTDGPIDIALSDFPINSFPNIKYNRKKWLLPQKVRFRHSDDEKHLKTMKKMGDELNFVSNFFESPNSAVTLDERIAKSEHRTTRAPQNVSTSYTDLQEMLNVAVHTTYTLNEIMSPLTPGFNLLTYVSNFELSEKQLSNIRFYKHLEKPFCLADAIVFEQIPDEGLMESIVSELMEIAYKDLQYCGRKITERFDSTFTITEAHEDSDISEVEESDGELNEQEAELFDQVIEGNVFSQEMIDKYSTMLKKTHQCTNCMWYSVAIIPGSNILTEDNFDDIADELDEHVHDNDCEMMHDIGTEALVSLTLTQSHSIKEETDSSNENNMILDTFICTRYGVVKSVPMLIYLCQLCFQRILMPQDLFLSSKDWVLCVNLITSAFLTIDELPEDILPDVKQFKEFFLQQNYASNPFKLLGKDSFKDREMETHMNQLFDMSKLNFVECENTLMLKSRENEFIPLEELPTELIQQPTISPEQLGSQSIEVLEPTVHEYKSVPFLVSKAQAKVNELYMKVGRSILLGKYYHQTLRGILPIVLLQVLDNYMLSLETTSPILPYIDAYAQDVYRNMPRIRKYEQYKENYGYKIDKGDLIAYKVTRVSPVYLEKLLERISWIDDAEVNYISKTKLEVKVPINLDKSLDFFTEVKIDLYNYCSPNSLLHELLQIEIASKDLLEDILGTD